MHVLFVAGILNDDGVVLYGVGVAPMPCRGHVPALLLPAWYRWAAAKERAFDEEHGVGGILHILMHQIIGVCVLVFLRHVPVESRDFGQTPALDSVNHGSEYSKSMT